MLTWLLSSGRLKLGLLTAAPLGMFHLVGLGVIYIPLMIAPVLMSGCR